MSTIDNTLKVYSLVFLVECEKDFGDPWEGEPTFDEGRLYWVIGVIINDRKRVIIFSVDTVELEYLNNFSPDVCKQYFIYREIPLQSIVETQRFNKKIVKKVIENLSRIEKDSLIYL